MLRFFLIVMCIALFATSYALAAETDYQKAVTAYVKGDYSSAVQYLKDYVSETPEAKAYYLLGYASYALCKKKEAAGYFRQAYLIDPDFSPKSIGFEVK
jgi:TolA-binding protein